MYERTLALIGEESLNKIKRKNILVLGTGGVGGYAIETLVRSGIQNITIVDYDKIDYSNINRQIIANSNNIGNYKVNEWEKRIKEINKDIQVKKINEKKTKDNINILLEEKNIWNIIHTEVKASYQGQGIAKKLVLEVLESAKKEGKKVIADCSYAKKILEKGRDKCCQRKQKTISHTKG